MSKDNIKQEEIVHQIQKINNKIAKLKNDIAFHEKEILIKNEQIKTLQTKKDLAARQYNA